MLVAGPQVYFEIGIRIVIIHTLFHVDIHAAYRVYKTFKPLEIYNYIIMEFDAQKILHGFLRQFMSSIGEGRINFIPAMSFDIHPGVPGNREQGCFFIAFIHHHDKQGIAAPCVVFADIAAHHDNISLSG